MSSRSRVHLQEVVTRDGFQSEVRFIPTADKIALIDRLSRTGLAKIEVTSYASPKAIPMLADAEAVMAGITREPGVEYGVLVPNLKGAERAAAAKPDEFNLVMSVTEGHNLSNVRMTREQSFAALRDVVALAKRERIPVNVSLSCCFGCPIDGEVTQAQALGWAARYLELGVDGVSLCDTTGMAFPSQVAAMVREYRRRWPDAGLTMHFHNTRGLGLANVLASANEGATRFDGSLGGLGGCPYAPGATGNVCTEDVAHLLELEGFDTGVDLLALLAVARDIPTLVGHEVPGQVMKAGRRLDRPAR
ncbi:MAG TPA: hydroxymethylglutaryl-CoA lyase [Nevskiaceae bacterium]|nr:hydroxymethylglutaryl-CoA lyase [Nevskiaceae bacterium]